MQDGFITAINNVSPVDCNKFANRIHRVATLRSVVIPINSPPCKQRVNYIESTNNKSPTPLSSICYNKSDLPADRVCLEKGLSVGKRIRCAVRHVYRPLIDPQLVSNSSVNRPTYSNQCKLPLRSAISDMVSVMSLIDHLQVLSRKLIAYSSSSR